MALVKYELKLFNLRIQYPEQFHQSEQQAFQSDLYIIPKSDNDLGIIGFVELVVGLFLLGGIYTKGGKKATLIEIARVFERMFNFKFGDIYKKQIKLFDRKGCNLTKLLDSLKNLLDKESRKRNNEK